MSLFVGCQQDEATLLQSCRLFFGQTSDDMEYFDNLELDGGVVIGFLFVTLVAMAGNWRLFVKSGQPGWSVVVPGYNVVIAMRIVGRPDSHALRFLIPGYNVFFFFKTIMELAASFGKRSNLDFGMAAVFNIFYILNLGLSEDEEYQGPVFGQDMVKGKRPHLAVV